MTLPNFLVIGAAKAGTTTMYFYLNQHPQIYMCPRKEPHYFSSDKRYKISTLSEYESLFQGVSDEILAIGEASTSYLTHPHAAERIQRHLPNTKLIAILRDPANRAYSHYLMSMKVRKHKLDSPGYSKQELNDDFAKIVSSKENVIIQAGFYYRNLEGYLKLFERNQIQVYWFKDFISHPDTVMRNIFEFLGVDTAFNIDKSIGNANQGGFIKNQFSEKLINNLKNNYKKYISPIIPMMWEYKMKKKYVDVRKRNRYKPQLPIEIRQQLIEVYREDILKLQDLLQRDLSIWLQ